jgi:hypothetical protein
MRDRLPREAARIVPLFLVGLSSDFVLAFEIAEDNGCGSFSQLLSTSTMATKQAMEAVGAAAVAFVLTTLYLQQTPRRVDENPQAATAPEPAQIPNFVSPTKAREVVTMRSAAATQPLPPQSRVHKDPFAEQERELAEYFGGIGNIAPVNEPLKQALLESKFRHRIAFDLALKDAGVKRETLSNAERAYAHEAAARALTDYRRDFLIDVKPLLSEQQYTMLADFEATEFKRRLAALQTEINSK